MNLRTSIILTVILLAGTVPGLSSCGKCTGKNLRGIRVRSHLGSSLNWRVLAADGSYYPLELAPSDAYQYKILYEEEIQVEGTKTLGKSKCETSKETDVGVQFKQENVEGQVVCQTDLNFDIHPLGATCPTGTRVTSGW